MARIAKRFLIPRRLDGVRYRTDNGGDLSQVACCNLSVVCVGEMFASAINYFAQETQDRN
jgi:hypothetical protein